MSAPFPPPHVVYHVAAMGSWQQVVTEQLALLASVGLKDVAATFVGEGLDWLHRQALQSGIKLTVVQYDTNIAHYETFAMLYIERLAKVEKTEIPILYFHTKGVSNPSDAGKEPWRKMMEECVIKPWESNLYFLQDHDVVGLNWLDAPGGHPHFSGNFWLAHPNWIRQLPNFVSYHTSLQMVRYSCEFWIGSKPGCRPMSHRYRNEPFWERPWRWG